MMSNKEKNFVSIVVYVHNQQDRIAGFLSETDLQLEKHFDKYEIICVNDASTDKSVEEIRMYASKYSGGGILSILNMSFFQGLELSMNAGVDLAIGDFVYEFDSLTGGYPAELLWNVYQRSLEGYDIVSAAPLYKGNFWSKIFYRVFNKASNTQYMLRTETFRILSRRALNRVHAMSVTIPYRKAVYANCGLKLDALTYENEKPLQTADRAAREVRRNTAADAMILYTDIAYKASIGFSMVMVMLTALIGFYAVVIYVSGKPIAGWTTTMLVLSFAFMGMFLILTVMIKYISVLLRLNFNKQKYIVESIEKINN